MNAYAPLERRWLERLARAQPLWAFVTLAYAFSWLAWAPLVLKALGRVSEAPQALHLLGGLGPMLAAVTVTVLGEGQVGARRLALEALRVKGRVGWVLLAAVAPVALYQLAHLVVGRAGQWGQLGSSPEYPQLGVAQHVVVSVFFYGFGEEVGWRGFALPKLGQSMGLVRASLVLAAIWAVWHLPLFAFSPGMSSMNGPAVLGWLASMVSGSLLMTWLFTASRGSVVAVALFHGVLDVVMTGAVDAKVVTVVGASITALGFAVPFALRKRGASQ